MNVKQTGGNHYEKMAYQPIDFIMAIKADFPTGCVIKYVSRYKMKNGTEDLQKAIDNITFMQKTEGYRMVLDPVWLKLSTQYFSLNKLSQGQKMALLALFHGDFNNSISWIKELADQYGQTYTPIGETFEYAGSTYRVEEGELLCRAGGKRCSLYYNCEHAGQQCVGDHRPDGKDVIFVKVEDDA